MSEQGSVHYEKTDVSTAKVTRVGVAVFGISALVAVALIGYLSLLVRGDERRAAPARALGFESRREAPLPRLQEAPFVDVRALRAEEELALSSFGWVDRQAGVVRVPIEVAMRLYVERSAGGSGEPVAPRSMDASRDARQAQPVAPASPSGVRP